ncbi:hypothetical protein [Nocardia abscessus]|uniref:hypothetical protein n=1 Tax=Nocardia abscessus TaxID=120957 RepID=UPI0024559EA2|nr:hypothetical protein [Nocardia abscessus]
MPVDFTTLPKGQLAWSELVEHLCDTGDHFETDYLEVKSDVDPTDNVGRAKIAKFILGTANRLPELAEQHFEGHAVMVLGVAKGDIQGVPIVDEKDLKNRVAHYTGGGTKPTWWTERVLVPGTGTAVRFVLIIVVAPPQYGDPIWPCRKEFPDPVKKSPMLLDGGIYVRPTSETRPAKAADIDSLCARLTAGTSPEADISVNAEGIVYRIQYHDELLDRYIAAVRKELGNPEENDGGPSMFAGIVVGDFRGADGFQREVDEWEAGVRAAWSDVVDHVVGCICTSPKIRVSNSSKVYLKEPEIHVRLNGEIRPVEMAEDIKNARGHLPDIPEKWGAQWNLTSYLPTSISSTDYSGDFLSPDSYGVLTCKEDESGVELSLSLKDMRRQPYPTYEAEFVLITVDDPTPDAIKGNWLLTAADHPHVYQGPVTLRVETIDVTRELIQALSATLPRGFTRSS